MPICAKITFVVVTANLCGSQYTTTKKDYYCRSWPLFRIYLFNIVFPDGQMRSSYNFKFWGQILGVRLLDYHTCLSPCGNTVLAPVDIKMYKIIFKNKLR